MKLSCWYKVLRVASTGLSFRVLPRGAIFGDKGPGIVFLPFDNRECLSVCGVINSSAFRYLVSLQLGTVKLAQSYEAGVIQQTPFPQFDSETGERLATLARRAWSLRRGKSAFSETSHAFLLPEHFRERINCLDATTLERELGEIQAEIDEISFNLFGFGGEDRLVALSATNRRVVELEEDVELTEHDDDESFDEDDETQFDALGDLLGWAVGVCFGRFDWRLATGEREAPPEPDPFDPLPATCPGMTYTKA